MPLYANIGGSRKEINSLYANIDGAQKTMSAMYTNIDGAQKQIFSNQKSVKLATLTAGQSFYITDSEGFSEYKVLGLSKNETISSNPTCILAYRVNALSYDILDIVKNCATKWGEIYDGYAELPIDLEKNGLNGYINWARDVAYSYRMYTYHGYNGLSAEGYVFLGREDLVKDNTPYYGTLTFDQFGTNYRKDVVKTRYSSDVPCYYNRNYYEPGENVDWTTLYYSKSGNKENECYFHEDKTTGTKTFSSFPSSLYFRPHLVFRDQTVIITTS